MPLRILGLLSQKGGELGSEEFWGYLNIYIYIIYIYILSGHSVFTHWIIG